MLDPASANAYGIEMGSHLELKMTATETAATLGRQTESPEKRVPIGAPISSSLTTVLWP